MFNKRAGRIFATAISRNMTEDRAVIFRFIKTFEPSFDRATQPVRIILVWDYSGDRGQPALAERVCMDAMEDALEKELDDDSATLALVSTGENSREWICYTRSEDAFVTRLNKGLTDLPIVIHAAPDPEWTTYTTFCAGVVAGDGNLEITDLT